MPDENELTVQPKPEPANERLGDILRKERITRRIALETIAKDLKLNVKYIRALESNEYHDLPSDPYIRVYLRSLSKYLLLDPDDILKKFYEERGIHDEHFRKDSDSKITITMSRPEKRREIKPWLIILVVIIALACISLIAKKFGSGSVPISENQAKTEQQADTQVTKQPQGRVSESSEDSLLGSLIPHDQPPSADTSNALQKDTAQMNLLLKIKPGRDSVWVLLFSDGVSWKNWLKPNQIKKFTARDSFNITVSNNRLLEYVFNGKLLSISGSDRVIFKIGRTMKQPELWNILKWNSVFKNRT